MEYTEINKIIQANGLRIVLLPNTATTKPLVRLLQLAQFIIGQAVTAAGRMPA